MEALAPAPPPTSGPKPDIRNWVPRRAGVLAVLGERFPQETRALVTAITPALAGAAFERWLGKVTNFICRFPDASADEERGNTASTHPTSLWLQVTVNDLGIYCGHQSERMHALTRPEPDARPAWADETPARAQPHLRWCGLRSDFLLRVAARLDQRKRTVWGLLARWTEGGFPLHYQGPARGQPPTGPALLRKATSVVYGGSKARLREKIVALLDEGGPMFGPFHNPPFTRGIISPVLVVDKKNGTVRPVYHCSYPHDRRRPSASRSLNGGIHRDAFWFPTYDSVASWVLQWYLNVWAGPQPTEARDFVVFKLDFESAFRQVPIRPSDWGLLMLYDASTDAYLLETCAAFGTRISADLWLRVANIWKVCFHASGFSTVMVYVDDLAVICPTTRIHDLLRLVATLEQRIGSRVHWGKVFVDGGCTHRATVLGVTVDVRQRVLELDPPKVRHRISQAQGLLTSEVWVVSELEKLVGAFNFFATALPTGRLLLGPLYALMGSGKDAVRVGSFHAAHLALRAWQDLLHQALTARLQQPIVFRPSETTWLATDASDTGFGGCSPFGTWSAPTAGLEHESINVRELAALWASITQVWGDQLHGKLLHAFVDNETARAWAGRPPSRAAQGRSWTQVVRLQHTLARRLLELRCTLVVHRIPTEENDVADLLSREPRSLLDDAVVVEWAANIRRRVEEDDGQRLASKWLAARAHDSPVLWWISKPTALGPLAPAHVRETVSPINVSDTRRFTRRPLLSALLQQHPPSNRHRLIDEDDVQAWWRSLSGPQEPRQ